MSSSEIAKVSQEHGDELEAPIELEEIKKAISVLRGDTSPGLDGLTVEFYKIFGQSL